METRGQRLKRLRKEMDLSQHELAVRIRSTRSSISMYECDERWPDFETLDNLAELFDASFDYLLCKTDINSGYPGKDHIRHAAHPSIQQRLLQAYTIASPDTQAAIRAILHLEG